MAFSFKNFIAEELTDEQKKTVDSWGKSPAERISSHVIPAGQHRIVIPVDRTSVPKESLNAPYDVKQHLEKHGYEIHDYHAGLVKDKYGRQMKLGKALTVSKAPDHIVKQFTQDPDRSNLKSSSHEIVISRHPHDVAGMSTDRGWTSCMHMEAGSNDYLRHDIKEGTHVAYLVHKGDHEIKNPVARLAIKPLHSTNSKGTHTILRPEATSYGEATDDFTHTVHKWAEHHFPLKNGHVKYSMPDELYHDGMPHTIRNFDHITKDTNHFHNLPESEKYETLADMHHVSHRKLRDKLVNEHVEKFGMPKSLVARTLFAQIGTEQHREHLMHDEVPYVRRAAFMHARSDDKVTKHLAANETHSGNLVDYAKAGYSGVNHTIARRLNQAPDLQGYDGLTHSLISNSRHLPEVMHEFATSPHHKMRALAATHSIDHNVLTKLAHDSHHEVRNAALANEDTPKEAKVHYLFSDNKNIQLHAALGLKHEDISEHIDAIHPHVKSTFASETTHPKNIEKLINTKGDHETHMMLLDNFTARKHAAHKFLNHENPTIQTFARNVYKKHVEQLYGLSLEDAIKTTPSHF